MIPTEELNRIFGRIITGSYKETDAAELTRATLIAGQGRIQLGKYNVNLADSNQIQIGDRIYQGLDAHAIKEYLGPLVKALENKTAESQPPAWPEIRTAYLKRLEEHLRRWSEKYTDLRLTADIRVATYKGQRRKRTFEKGSWWFHDALKKGETGESVAESLVILGDPGGGKTTACQRSAWELAKAGLAAEANNGHDTNLPVPIYIEVSRYRKDPTSHLAPYQRILALLAQEMKRLLAVYSVTHESLEQYLRASPFILFFDGLNELGLDHRESLIADLLSFIDTFSGANHQFILTTRKLDYEYDFAPLLPSDRFLVLEILELDSSGVNEFIMRDLGRISDIQRTLELPAAKPETRVNRLKQDVLNRLQSGEFDPEEDPELIPRIEKLLGKVVARPKDEITGLVSDLHAALELIKTLRDPDYSRVLWLAQNPSTLKDIVDVYRAEKTIPRSRVRLFERAIEARLNAQEAKLGEQRSRFDRELKFSALQKVALEMIEPKRGLQLERELVLNAIREVLERRQLSTSPDDLLQECVFQDALLVEKAYGSYSFVKQPYQEYFVARELKGRWRLCLDAGRAPLSDGYLRCFFNNRYYFQMVSSMAGLLDSYEVPGLVQRLRKRKRTQRLAALCARNAEELPEHVVKDYIAWTKQHILRFSLLPEGIVNGLVLVLVTIFLAGSLSRERAALFGKGWNSAAFMMAQFPYTQWHQLFFNLFMASTLVAALFVCRKLCPAHRETTAWKVEKFAVLVIVSVFVLAAFGRAGSNWTTAVVAVCGFAWMALFLQLMIVIGGPAVGWMNTKLEEHVVNRHLIHYLEVMRDIGPNATSTINEIQYSVANNRLMSDRIKDTIERTWAVSPRTVLQIINEINVTSRQAEAIRILEGAILRSSSSTGLREQAVAALFQIANAPANSGVMLGVVEVLGNVGLEEPDYRPSIVTRLREVLSNLVQPLNVRRRAWRSLADMGVKDIEWPRRRLRDLTWLQWALVALAALAIGFILATIYA